MKNNSPELKEKLLSVLKYNLKDIVLGTKTLDRFFDYMGTKGFDQDDLNHYINDLDNIDEAQESILLSLLAGVNHALDKLDSTEVAIDELEYFTNTEILANSSYRYSKPEIYEKKSFPLELRNVIEGNANSFTVNMTARELGELSLNLLTYWNEDIQREGDKKRLNGKIVVTPKLYPKNRKEIKENILNNTQNETLTVLNIPLGITFEAQDQEEKLFPDRDLNYDKKKMLLQIDSGARFDIVDGTHRIQACADAILEDYKNENLDRVHFTVKILNVDDEEARSYQAQLAKATPLKKSRVKELDVETYASQVVLKLKNSSNSDLRQRISSFDAPKYSHNEVTTFYTMETTINTYFRDDLKKQFDVNKIFKVLNEYYTYLFGYFSEVLNDKDNHLFKNKTFGLHNKIAYYMYKNNIPMEELLDIIDPENFNMKKLSPEDKRYIERIQYLDKNKTLNERRVDKLANIFKTNTPQE